MENLWKIYGNWIHKTLKERNIRTPIPLSIITQGALSLLPLSMAKNPDDSSYLLDFVEISYVPSLYALYSLQSRLKFWRKSEKLGYITDKSMNTEKGEFNLPTWPIEQKLCFSAFDRARCDKTSANNFELEEIRRVCGASTHWHFSAHGQFNYKYFEKSHIELEDRGKITPSLLSALKSKEFLRLVVLSACQTGMSEMLDNELAPESFLTEFLKFGAIGAIGTLWETPDISASLILGRFYHFHLTENQEPAAALHDAQIWLRDITLSEFRKFVIEHFNYDEECKKISGSLLKTLRKDGYEDGSRPFENPFYWAGFILVGQ